MPERVEIVVTANDGASQILRGIGSQLGGLGNVISALTNGDIVGLTGQVIEFGRESVQAFTDGAQAAKQLSMVGGTSMEDASRFIQVLDDYEISQQDALTATKALTKEGLAPNIDTLAELSDQYKALEDPQKKNEFLMRNLGRAGFEWAKVLEQGGDALREQSAAIDENLIFTEEMYQQAEKLRLAQDELNDEWEVAKIQIGSKLVPALTDALHFSLEFGKATEDNIQWWEKLLPPIGFVHAAIISLTGDEGRNSDAINQNSEALAGNDNALLSSQEQMKLEQQAIQELSKENQNYLSTVATLTGSIQAYEEKEASLKAEHSALLAEKQTLLQQGYAAEEGALEAVNEKLAANEEAMRKNADEHEKATYKMILNMLQQRLAEDGLSEAETQFLLNQGVQWGVYSQEAVTQASAIMSQVDEMVARYNEVPAEVSTDIVTNHYDNYFTNVEGSAGFSNRAGGGDVFAGNLYRVNETRTEYFQPAQNGTVIPLGAGDKGGNGQAITVVYSPMISTADRSEVQNRLLPAIIEGVRKARADRII